MNNDFQVHIMKLIFIESTRTSKQEMRRALGDPSAWYKILTTRRHADIVIDRNLCATRARVCGSGSKHELGQIGTLEGQADIECHAAFVQEPGSDFRSFLSCQTHGILSRHFFGFFNRLHIVDH